MTTKLKTALVTGASSGIGAATVKALTGAGLKVWAMARRQDRLEALAAETGCTPLIADIRDGAALDAALDGLSPDVLVNNAG
nr:SDR family NAD(P)-dependent oxidoreductase [Hyphomicrobiales bacterium]